MWISKKKSKQISFDSTTKKPIIRASICNGEQIAGFKDIRTGKFEEIMLIKSELDIEQFKTQYGITGEISKEY